MLHSEGNLKFVQSVALIASVVCVSIGVVSDASAQPNRLAQTTSRHRRHRAQRHHHPHPLFTSYATLPFTVTLVAGDTLTQSGTKITTPGTYSMNANDFVVSGVYTAPPYSTIALSDGHTVTMASKSQLTAWPPDPMDPEGWTQDAYLSLLPATGSNIGTASVTTAAGFGIRAKMKSKHATVGVTGCIFTLSYTVATTSATTFTVPQGQNPAFIYATPTPTIINYLPTNGSVGTFTDNNRWTVIPPPPPNPVVTDAKLIHPKKKNKK